MMKKQLTIEGMHCTSCAQSIETVLKLKGYTCQVDFESKQAECTYSNETDLENQIKEIENLGYQVYIQKKKA